MNKNIIVIIYLIFMFSCIKHTSLLCQNNSVYYPLNEFSISANYFLSSNENPIAKFGFGIGAYKAFFDDKRFNLVTGISFDRVSYFVKNEYRGHYSHMEDVTYILQSLSCPVIVRCNIGKKIKFFIELGMFLEVNIFYVEKGTLVSQDFESMAYSSKKIKEISNPNSNSFGATIGLGLKIPLKKNELLIKLSGYQCFTNISEDGMKPFSKSYANLSFGYRLIQNINKE